MKQLPLPLTLPVPGDKKDFVVSECNREAFEWLEKWTLGLQTNFVCLVGEKGSGKTHMAHIWASMVGAEFLSQESLLAKCNGAEEFDDRFYVLDKADELQDGLRLFYLYNAIKEANAFLLLTAKTYPTHWKVQYEDVRSRLRTIDVIQIHRPSEQEMNDIIGKMLLRRGIVGTTEIVEYITNRIERTYETINYWVNKIDEYQIQTGHKVTIQTIREMFK